MSDALFLLAIWIFVSPIAGYVIARIVCRSGVGFVQLGDGHAKKPWRAPHVSVGPATDLCGRGAPRDQRGPSAVGLTEAHSIDELIERLASEGSDLLRQERAKR